MRVPILLLSLCLVLIGIIGCAGDLPEGKTDGAPVVVDQRVADQRLVWDSVPLNDWWAFPDLYSGAVFGCRDDADCFGRRCCATPWNVRVCAERCTTP